MSSASSRTASTRASLWELRLSARVWRFFCSIKLALFLILALAALILVGTLVDQVPASTKASPSAYKQWLEQARGRYGPWTDLFEKLQFFSIFSATYFRALIGLLTVNIIVCTLNRWRAIWVTTFRSRVLMRDSFFQHARFNATIRSPLPLSETAARMKRSLSFARYKVSLEKDPASGAVGLLADKNRFSPYGTFLTHLSIVLILAGAILGSLFGFEDSQFVVAEGSVRTVAGTDLAIRLEHFADEYYLEGPPKDFRSEVTLLENGRPVKEATIRVNSPLRYKGVTFHQSFYGQTAIMKVTDSQGRVLYSDGVPLAWTTRDGGRPVGGFDLPEQNLSVWVIGPRSGENDPLIRAGQMRVELFRGNVRVGSPVTLTQGDPATINDLTFTFERESRFTGLKVVKDPGVNLIWVASALLVLGMVTLFYFPRRRAWALLSEQADGTTEVKLAMPAQRDFSPDAEFRRLRSRVIRALGATPGRSETTGNEGDDHV